jgi:hypothetical protein
MAKNDEFIRRNLEISKKAHELPEKQDLQLGIFRNDYMIDRYKKFIYQIEINTIASSMGTFSDGLKKFFKYFSHKYPQYYKEYFNAENSEYQIPLEKEDVIDKMASAMKSAVYNINQDSFCREYIIVFIVQENERNEFDQRSIEKVLWEKQLEFNP